MAADAHSAAAVAMAAPATPRPALKMRIGSRMTLSDCVRSVILRGVTTSKMPRKVAKPTNASIAGTSAKAWAGKG